MASRCYTKAGRSVSLSKGTTLKVDMLRCCGLYRCINSPVSCISASAGGVTHITCACSKMDIIPRKRSKKTTFNKHISMAVRGKSACVGVDKSRVSIFRSIQSKKKMKVRRKRKTTPKTDKF
ncbi:hypothetical protein TNCV_4893511 [Trichonephila clavipes]|nr:hypothetical protein TNCV_4893511 [Trichonephila clavipes]